MLWNIQRCRSNHVGHFLVSLRQLFQVCRLEVVRHDWRERQTNISRFILQESVSRSEPSSNHAGLISIACLTYDFDVITSS